MRALYNQRQRLIFLRGINGALYLDRLNLAIRSADSNLVVMVALYYSRDMNLEAQQNALQSSQQAITMNILSK